MEKYFFAKIASWVKDGVPLFRLHSSLPSGDCRTGFK
jgi:hypothetical protein